LKERLEMGCFSIAFGLAIFLLTGSAQAGSTANTVPLSVRSSPLIVAANGMTAECSWPAGTVVAAYSAIGGNGKPITWALTGDTADFVLSTLSGPTTNVVVAPSGIASAVCGTTATITVTATQ